MSDALRVSPEGDEIVGLVRPLLARSRRERVLLGVVGAPGAGKSRLADAVAALAGDRARAVPMDGFHLADVELARQGLSRCKGAPETFDAWGYAALLERLRARPGHVVYAPAFERELEQPLAGAVPVAPEVDLVVTEGNYLLLEEPGWRAARACLDEVWFVDTDEALRRERLVARHVAFGKRPEEARAWVSRVDDPNAALVQAGRDRADARLDLTGWSGRV